MPYFPHYQPSLKPSLGKDTDMRLEQTYIFSLVSKPGGAACRPSRWATKTSKQYKTWAGVQPPVSLEVPPAVVAGCAGEGVGGPWVDDGVVDCVRGGVGSVDMMSVVVSNVK